MTKQKQEEKRNKKTISGTVVSDKMKDTAVVLVSRYVKHPKYQKFYKTSKKYKAQDTGNSKKVGDKIVIEETKPVSKTKKFKVID